ncbi:MAG: DinB family protein [Vicinamibacterales bacterium]
MITQAPTPVTPLAQLRLLFSMNHSLLTKNLDGVNDALATARPGDGNAIAWSLGHIVYWRQAILGMLGGRPVWNDGDAEGFKGTSRDLPATIDKSWAEIGEAYRESHDRLMAALAAADPEPDALKGLTQLQCHETYHVGQIALARRVVGLPGAI